jgi:hypothetical protein
MAGIGQVGRRRDMATIQLAFAGHNRAHDLGQHQTVIEGLDAAFDLIGQAGIESARLLTGLASGADELAAAAWRRARLGPTHAIFPFLHDPESPEIGEGALAQSATWLDGESTEKAGRNPHLKQTRLVVETADLLVVVWTGERARGAGGTADAVRCALEMGLAVLWIKPSDSPTLRLIRPEKLPFDFDFHEFQEGLAAGLLDHVEPATAENLRAVLALDEWGTGGEDAGEPAPPGGLWMRVDAWLHTWLWKTYGSFRRFVGGAVGGLPPGPPVPPDLAEQPGFAMLTAAYAAADQHANRLAAVHRSEQILLVMAMVTAAVVGSSPAVWPELKLTAVAVELMLGLAALLVWSSAAKARQHERWGEERRLAEMIRLERAGWALGVSLLSTRRRTTTDNGAAFGREILRAAGLPHGRFDAQRIAAWGAWAMSELVDGQAAYHQATSVRDNRIAHRIHLIENGAFVALLAILSSYLVLNLGLATVDAHLPHWVSGIVTMASTIVPAVAAATMALEAKLEFKEQSERSHRISNELEDLRLRLGPEPSFDALQGAARLAMRLHVAEASQWGEGVGRRRLFRP